jgi:streptomycin 6-kinase
MRNTANLPFPPPQSLEGFGSSEEGRAWLARLPSLLRECVDQWQLELGDPFPDAAASLTVAAALRDGSDAVLKLQFPHRGAEREAAALASWNGDGAVRLPAHDPTRHALLVERCRPGAPLSVLDQDAALDVALGLLPRLWCPPGRLFTSLSDEAARWADTLPHAWERAGRPFERRLLDAALRLIEHLSPGQGEQVLVHQDLHAENILRAEREPWLVIDPKPLAGEREFALAPIVRGAELGHSRAYVLHRLERLSGELGLDRERALGWAIVQTLAWRIEDTIVWTEMIEIARWLLGSPAG